MADKRKLLELDIDVEAIIAKSVQLKTELDKLKASQNDLKKSGDTNSETYVKLAAQLNKVSGEYNLNQKQLANLAQVNDKYLTINQKVALSLDKEINSISAARQSNSELLKIRNELNLSKESEAKLAAEINAKLDANNKFIKENVSGYEQQKIGIGDYKTAIKGAIEESGLFGGQIQNITQYAANFKGVYSKMNAELNSSISQIRNASAETEGMGRAQAASAVATNVGSGALRIFKLALAATGIGLLIIGVGLLVNGLSKLDPVMDLIEQATAGIGGAIDKASQIVVKFVSNITSIGDAFSKIGNLIAHPIDSIKSFSKEVGNAAKAAALLKEAEQGLGDLKDIYEVRNKNIESQIALDKIRLKSKDLTAHEEQEIEKRINKNFEKLSANRTEINNKTLDLSLQSAINTAQELNKVDQKRLEASIRFGDLAVANQLLNSGKITADAYNKLKEATNSVIDNRNKQAEDEQRAQDKIEKAQAKVEANAQKAEADKKKRQDDAQKAIDKGIEQSKKEIELFIAQQGIRTKSLEESLKFEEQIRDKKLALARQEFEVKKITETEFQLQSLNIKNEFLKKQSEATVAFAEIELNSYLEANKTKLEANKFLTDELVLQELDRINRVSEAEAAYQTKRLEEGQINAQQYADAIKAIDDKVAEDNKVLQEEKNQADIDKKAIDLQNKMASDTANHDYDLAFQTKAFEDQYAIEKAAAQKGGADMVLFESAQAVKKKAIDKSVQDNKLQLASQTLGNLADLLGRESAAGKAAAIAQVTIDTYKSATAAYSSLAGIPVVGPALGAVAAGVAVVSGLANVKKIVSTETPKKLARGEIDLDGPGTGTSDSIPAMLSKGESVINAKSTAMFKPLLSKINQAGGGVGFAGGGIPYPTSVLNTFNNTQGSQPINYDLLASKIGVNVAQANRSLPPNQLSLVDFHVQNNSYVDVVNGANF